MKYNPKLPTISRRLPIKRAILGGFKLDHIEWNLKLTKCNKKYEYTNLKRDIQFLKKYGGKNENNKRKKSR